METNWEMIPGAAVLDDAGGQADGQAGVWTATVQLGAGLPHVSVIDFSRVMVIVDAADVGVDAETDMNDAALCSRLETIRLAGAEAAGMGDCSGHDSPKLCVVAAPGKGGPQRAALRAWYWVNPGRCEAHPTLAITGASCLAAACGLPGTIPHALCAPDTVVWAPAAGGAAAEQVETAEYHFKHGRGVRSVTMWRRAGAPPHGVAYSNEVRVLARGELFVE